MAGDSGIQSIKDSHRKIKKRRGASCARRFPIATVIGPNDSEADLLGHAAALARTYRAREPVGLLARSRLYRLLTTPEGERRGSWLDSGRVREASLAALARIRADFPETPIRLAHLPERHEVAAGRYDSDELAGAAERPGMEYFPVLSRCHWSADMLHVRDPHPNAHGYAALSDCVEGWLFP